MRSVPRRKFDEEGFGYEMGECLWFICPTSEGI